jgi:hypothetical protein
MLDGVQHYQINFTLNCNAIYFMNVFTRVALCFLVLLALYIQQIVLNLKGHAYRLG